MNGYVKNRYTIKLYGRILSAMGVPLDGIIREWKHCSRVVSNGSEIRFDDEHNKGFMISGMWIAEEE